MKTLTLNVKERMAANDAIADTAKMAPPELWELTM